MLKSNKITVDRYVPAKKAARAQDGTSLHMDQSRPSAVKLSIHIECV